MKKTILATVLTLCTASASALDIYMEAEHTSVLDNNDYGLQTVGAGLVHNFTPAISVDGKLATPVSNYNDFHDVDGNTLDWGDPIANLRVRYTFGQ